MHTRALFLSFLFTLIVLITLSGCGAMPAAAPVSSAGGSPSPSPTSSASASPAPETTLLYVVLSPGTSMNTYAVARDGSSATQVGGTVALASAANQVEFTENNRFLYTVGNDPATGVTVSVYATNDSGAPQLPAVQTTSFAAGTGFLIHPSRNFAYEMKPGPSDFLSIQSTLYLQKVDPATGKFGDSPQQLSTFGPTWTSESLKRFSDDGTMLFDETDGTGPHASAEIAFRKSTVDPASGNLTLGDTFWTYSSYGGSDQSVSTSLGDQLVAFARISDISDTQSEVDIAPVVHEADLGDPPALIHCTSQMIAACATATYVRLDPAEQFVFATDGSKSTVHIFRIDLANKKLVDTGSSIPTSSPFAFSSDGSLVYVTANSGTAIQVYRFDHTSGALTPAAVINVGTQFSMYPPP